jgi:hypothetical protein
MTRLRIFLSHVFRHDPQYGYIGVALAWKLAGILARHHNDWRRIT